MQWRSCAESLCISLCILACTHEYNYIFLPLQYGESYVTGNAMIGLLVGFFLIFVAYTGISQLLDIQTSDRLGAKDPRESMSKM